MIPRPQMNRERKLFSSSACLQDHCAISRTYSCFPYSNIITIGTDPYCCLSFFPEYSCLGQVYCISDSPVRRSFSM